MGKTYSTVMLALSLPSSALFFYEGDLLTRDVYLERAYGIIPRAD